MPRANEMLVCSCGSIGNSYGMRHTWWCRNLPGNNGHPESYVRRWAPR